MSLTSLRYNINNILSDRNDNKRDYSSLKDEKLPLLSHKSLSLPKNKQSAASYSPTLLNRFEAHTIPDLLLRLPFIKRNKISPRVIKKSSLFKEYLESIKKDEFRFKNDFRIKYCQHQMWQGMLATSVSQAEKRQHSRIRNFFFFKSKGNSHQRLATSNSVAAWSNDPSTNDYETETFWGKLGHKIQSLLTFDTTKNLHLLSDGYKMRQGYLKAGQHGQKDILPSHLSTTHAAAIAKLIGGSDVFVASIAGLASVAGLVMDGRAQMNVNIAQETFIDGMVSRLSNSVTNVKQLESEFKKIEGKIQELSSTIFRLYGEFNSERLKEPPDLKKVAYLRNKLKDNFAISIFNVVDFPKDINSRTGRLNKNKYYDEFIKYSNDDDINVGKLYLLQFFSEKELDESKEEIIERGGSIGIPDILSNCVNKKISSYSKDLKKETESYQEHHRRHVDNFKEVFSVHFYQNQARLLGAAGVGVSFAFGVPFGAIISMLGKGALQLLTSSLDEAIRYNFRMSTFVKDGASDFFYQEALDNSLGEYMRNSSLIDFEKKMAYTIFSDKNIQMYEDQLTNLLSELSKKQHDNRFENKNLIIDLQIKINGIKELIEIRKSNKSLYYGYKQNFERMLNNKILGTDKGDVIWNRQDYQTYLLIQDKLKPTSTITPKDRYNLDNQSRLLLEKAECNSKILFNKLLNAKTHLNSINKYTDNTNPEAIEFNKNKVLLQQLSANEEYIKFRKSTVNICSKYLNIFTDLVFNFNGENLENACLTIYGEKAWNNFSDSDKSNHTNQIKQSVKHLQYLNYWNNKAKDLNIFNQILKKEKEDSTHEHKSNKQKLDVVNKSVNQIEEEIKNAKIKYSQVYLSVTTPNLRKAENALAEAAINKEAVKNKLVTQTKMREDQANRVFNHRLSGLLRKVTNSNLKISNYLITLGVPVSSINQDKIQNLCKTNRIINELYKQSEKDHAEYMQLQKDIMLIKKSIMFSRKKPDTENNGNYITKDGENKYVTVYPEWENAHEKISENNLWVKQIFTDNTYLNWQVGNVDTVKPGEYSAQIGYRFFNLPGRLSIPLIGLFTELAEMANLHTADPAFSNPSDSHSIFNSKLADIHSSIVEGKTFGHVFGGGSILSFILFGIWNLKYNKQHFANDPFIQKKISNLEKLIDGLYTNMIKEKYGPNYTNFEKVNFHKIELEDKTELNKIDELVNYLQKNNTDKNNGVLFDAAFYAMGILKEAQTKPVQYLNDNKILPYTRLPKEMKIMEKQSNNEEVCIFNLNPAITNHYAASSLGKTGKYARTRATIATLPKRAKQILPNALLGAVLEPIKIINTHNNYNKVKSSYNNDIGIMGNIIKESSSLMLPKYFNSH